MSREDTNVQLYWIIFEAWCAQVDSYWQRTNYFAAFEIAAIAGTWEVLHEKDYSTGRDLFWFGAALTGFWIYSNVKTHGYVDYWWEVLKEIEARQGWEKRPDFVANYDERRQRLKLGVRKNKLKYSVVTNWIIPIFFLVVWGILVWSGRRVPTQP